jgi:hypothetical protein
MEAGRIIGCMLVLIAGTKGAACDAACDFKIAATLTSSSLAAGIGL